MTGHVYRGRMMVGMSEIAHACGHATTAAVTNWIVRHPTFPMPAIVVKAGVIWEWRKVRDWLVANGKGHTDPETGQAYDPSDTD